MGNSITKRGLDPDDSTTHELAGLPLRRSRFEAEWAALPPLTILLAAPGWGKTLWLAQCAEYLTGLPVPTRIAQVTTHTDLGSLQVEGPTAPVVVLIDEVEAELAANDAVWRTIHDLASQPGLRFVVTAIDAPPAWISSLDPVIHDERELAFDTDELAELATLLVAAGANVDVFTIPTATRGCPALVHNYLTRTLLQAKRGVWGFPKLVPDLHHPSRTPQMRRMFETTETGRAVPALEGFRTFTRESIELLPPTSSVSAAALPPSRRLARVRNRGQ